MELSSSFPVSDVSTGQVVSLEGTDGLYRAVSRETAAGRASLLLSLGHLHLQTGEGKAARARFDEGLTLTRSHRTARLLRGRLLTGASLASRAQGSFREALALAEAAVRVRNQAPEAAASASLALAGAHRLGGSPWNSLTPTHAALDRSPTAEARVARVLTWMMLTPAEMVQEAENLASQVTGELRARLAWHLAEYALISGNPESAGHWLIQAQDDRRASEEGRVCPLAARKTALILPPVTDVPAPVEVLTLSRRGLLVGERFIPVPGNGHLLALLVFLIRDGATHWSRAAEAVLVHDTSDETALYMQIRTHLRNLRQFVGDPQCVTSRRGILELTGDREWRCDIEGALASGRGAPDWLPSVTGWWAGDLRARLQALQ